MTDTDRDESGRLAMKQGQTTAREAALQAIRDERDRQIEKWGDRTTLATGRTAVEWSTILTEEAGELAEAALHFHFGPDEDPHAIYREAIQTAAVAVAIAESVEREAIRRDDQ